MKKMMMALMVMLTIAAKGTAMSYEQARNEALFLTDKMAYELNLTNEQYEAAYEINLDYLMGVSSYDDVYGTYWERRNLDMSYVLLDWQWNNFLAASYFYRPLYWRDGYWHFGIYARYPHRDYFYFGRPVFYASYRGAHAWHHVGGRGYYYGRRDHYRPAHGRSHFGMLDRWNRGDYRGSRMSSTRTTVNRHHNGGQPHRDYNRGNSRPQHRSYAGANSQPQHRSYTGGNSQPQHRSHATQGGRPTQSTQPRSHSAGPSSHSAGPSSHSASQPSHSGGHSSHGGHSGGGRSASGGRSFGGHR